MLILDERNWIYQFYVYVRIRMYHGEGVHEGFYMIIIDSFTAKDGKYWFDFDCIWRRSS